MKFNISQLTAAQQKQLLNKPKRKSVNLHIKDFLKNNPAVPLKLTGLRYHYNKAIKTAKATNTTTNKRSNVEANTTGGTKINCVVVNGNRIETSQSRITVDNVCIQF
jgi:hypothetical protein